MAPSASASLARSASSCSAMTSTPTCTLSSRMRLSTSSPSASPSRTLMRTASGRSLSSSASASATLCARAMVSRLPPRKSDSSSTVAGSSSTMRMVPRVTAIRSSVLRGALGALARRRALHPDRDAGQRLVEAGGVRAAALGQVRAPTALAAHGLRDLLDELAGLQALAEVLGDRSDQVDLALHGRAEADHAGAHPLAQGVHHRAQPFGIEAVESRREHGHARHGLRRRGQVLGLVLREAGLELLELLLELLLLVEELLEASRQLERRDLEKAGRLAQRRLLLAHVFPRGVARHGVDAANPRGDGALGDDLEEPDLPRRVEVGAAAQLGGEVADPDDAHAVAVLLAEERHGPAPERGLKIHLRRRDDDVGLDVLVDEVLDLLDLSVLEAHPVGEVEAQVIGRDEGARLGHVGAEDPPERGVEQMGPGMVEPQPLAAA